MELIAIDIIVFNSMLYLHRCSHRLRYIPVERYHARGFPDASKVSQCDHNALASLNILLVNRFSIRNYNDEFWIMRTLDLHWRTLLRMLLLQIWNSISYSLYFEKR